MKCLPIDWANIGKFKSRCDSVLATLSSKAVNREKMLEFQKQLVSARGLKEYFKTNPQEKEILMSNIQKASKHSTDKSLFKSLDIIPPYLVPDAIMMVTEEEMAQSTIGVNLAAMPVSMQHSFEDK